MQQLRRFFLTVWYSLSWYMLPQKWHIKDHKFTSAWSVGTRGYIWKTFNWVIGRTLTSCLYCALYRTVVLQRLYPVCAPKWLNKVVQCNDHVVCNAIHLLVDKFIMCRCPVQWSCSVRWYSHACGQAYDEQHCTLSNVHIPIHVHCLH